MVASISIARSVVRTFTGGLSVLALGFNGSIRTETVWSGTGAGTSIAAPEWAALLAIASAQRALVNLPVLTSVQNALY